MDAAGPTLGPSLLEEDAERQIEKLRKLGTEVRDDFYSAAVTAYGKAEKDRNWRDKQAIRCLQPGLSDLPADQGTGRQGIRKAGRASRLRLPALWQRLLVRRLQISCPFVRPSYHVGSGNPTPSASLRTSSGTRSSYAGFLAKFFSADLCGKARSRRCYKLFLPRMLEAWASGTA